MTRTAVVGHVEWVEFVRVPHLPAAGEIVHAERAWEEAGGGGAVAAVQLAKLSDDSVFFTALSDTDLGRRARAQLEKVPHLRVESVYRSTFQRRAVTHIDDAGERTITVIGDRMNPHANDPLPWDELSQVDSVYFTGGDAGALEAARRARVVVASTRVLPLLADARVQLDVVVGSAADPSETYVKGDIDPEPTVAVRTEGPLGGSYELADDAAGRWEPTPLPGEVRDAYGCGDSFAAGLTFGLGAGMPLDDALALGARCGAAVLTGHGPYQRQLTRADL